MFTPNRSWPLTIDSLYPLPADMFIEVNAVLVGMEFISLEISVPVASGE